VELAADGPSSSRLLREAAALAYVDSLEEPLLRPDDAYHFSVVLRLQPGEIMVASDGAGRYRGCRVTAGHAPGPRGREALCGREALRGKEALRGATVAHAGGRSGRSTVIALVPDTEVMAVRRPEPVITVGFSLVKPDRIDWAVAKLAELGVDRIVPLVCDRTVARSDGAAVTAKRAARLRRIAREASMVARRVWLPEVTDPLPLAEALSVLRAPAEVGLTGTLSGDGVALAEPGGAPPSLATPVVLVGPEGGWSPQELAGGLPTVRLGETILRVETAAVVTGALLTCLRSGTVAAFELRRTQPAQR
jgi:16S rRNA (uracil1498-N3)-methyltransferase